MLRSGGAAGGRSTAVGRRRPQEHVRVVLDPAGHPFCLFVDG
ncbi:MAG: hypothetical protein ABW328_20680 [Ilumatobacteraceae bacterium]